MDTKRTLLGLQLDAQSWKEFHAMRTNSSERTGVMDYPCQSTDTPEGTTEHKATHTSTEEPKKARNCRNVLVLSGKDLVVRGDHRSGFCERLQEAPSMSSRPNGSQLQGVPPLGKVEPIGDSSCTSGIMYLRWGEKPCGTNNSSEREESKYVKSRALQTPRPVKKKG